MKKTIKQKALAGLAILSLSTLAFGSAVAFANSNQTKSNRTSSVTSTVSVAQAQEKALKEAKGDKVIGYEHDVKYGNIIYEVSILDGKYEKEYKIDGQSGTIQKRRPRTWAEMMKTRPSAERPTSPKKGEEVSFVWPSQVSRTRLLSKKVDWAISMGWKK